MARFDRGFSGGSDTSTQEQQDDRDEEQRRRTTGGARRTRPDDRSVRNEMDRETEEMASSSDPERDAAPNDSEPPANDRDGTPGQTRESLGGQGADVEAPETDQDASQTAFEQSGEVIVREPVGTDSYRNVRVDENTATDLANDIRSQASDEVQSTRLDGRDSAGVRSRSVRPAEVDDPDTLQTAVDDTRDRFRREQEIERRTRIKEARATESPLEGAAERFVEQSVREQRLEPQEEQFGDSRGVFKDIETAVDEAAFNISEALRSRGAEFGRQADRRAERAPWTPAGTVGAAGSQRAISEIGEAAFNVAGDAVLLPSQGIEAIEAGAFLAGGTRAVAGDDADLGGRVDELGGAASRAASRTVEEAIENPEDVGAELLVGAVTGTSVARAGRFVRTSPSARPLREIVDPRVRGTDRAQFGAGGPQGDNVITLDDIENRNSGDGGETADLDVESDEVVQDGDQLMLMRTVQKQRTRDADGVEMTAEEQAGIGEMSLEEGIEELRAERAVEAEAAREAVVADVTAATVGATAPREFGQAEASVTAADASVDAGLMAGVVADSALASDITTSDAVGAFQTNVQTTGATALDTGVTQGLSTDPITLADTVTVGETDAITTATTATQTQPLATPTLGGGSSRNRRSRFDLDFDTDADAEQLVGTASDAEQFQNFVSDDLDRAIDTADFEVDL